jgi:hypothetical protein
MAAHHNGRARRFKDRQQAILGCVAREYFCIVARRGVAEQNGTNSLHVDTQRLGPRTDMADVGRAELLGVPAHRRANCFGKTGRRFSGVVLQDDAIAVAANELSWQVEVEQTVERLSRHRAWEHIAPNDDELYTGISYFLEDRLERREISMNVINRRDPFHTPIQTSEPNRRKADPITRIASFVQLVPTTAIESLVDFGHRRSSSS